MATSISLKNKKKSYIYKYMSKKHLLVNSKIDTELVEECMYSMHAPTHVLNRVNFTLEKT